MSNDIIYMCSTNKEYLQSWVNERISQGYQLVESISERPLIGSLRREYGPTMYMQIIKKELIIESSS